MSLSKKYGRLTDEELQMALTAHSHEFEKYYRWMEEHLPARFFEEITHDELTVIVKHFTAFHLNEYFAHLHFKNHAIILCLNETDTDIKILNLFNLYGIKSYQHYISNQPPPYEGISLNFRITIVYFTEFSTSKEATLPQEEINILYDLLTKESDDLSLKDFSHLVKDISLRFLRSLTPKQQVTILNLFLRAHIRDHCQYYVEYNELWSASKEASSLHILLAWKNSPKHLFLYRFAKMVYRHGLSMQKVNITYANPYDKNSLVLMSLGVHGSNGKAAWEVCDIEDFLQELVTLKCFNQVDAIETSLIDARIITGNQGNLLRCMVSFIHQALVHADANLYSLANIEEAFCRHPELTSILLKIFEYKFHPSGHQLEKLTATREHCVSLLQNLDTGHPIYDERRKNIFKQALNMIDHCLKTNYYRSNKSAFSFRLNPQYMTKLPYDTSEKFPELPFGIFYIQGMHFISFHIRFKDLSRGGLRTVIPKKLEQMHIERNTLFAECYNLAYTQQKKNKDIPEGGSKAVILLEPFESMHVEIEIYKQELKQANLNEEEILSHLETYTTQQRSEYLFQAQRAFVHSLITLTNYSEDKILRAKNILDYYQKPEYIYLGPDENMSNEMIEWIANYSEICHYPLGKAFISSKPSCGINHKEYGVTSLGVNVCMEEVLNYLEIDPYVETFTIKFTGGPDGDVAGNQIYNLYKYFKNTAKLLTLIDGSGTIYDPNGLDLEILTNLFKEGKPISFYPPKKLSKGGFLLDVNKKKEETLYSQKTLCWKNLEGSLVEDWISGNEMNHLLRSTVHQTPTDVFIPAGGRPRTLNQSNYTDFLDATGKPTSKAIIEGANLYLTPDARRELEKRGVLIIKDSSANKGGVITSSLEVLIGLTIPDQDFLNNKATIMKEVLSLIKEKARNEAQLLLQTHAETGAFLTDISDEISKKINTFTYELLDYLENKTLSHHPDNPLMQCLMNYCPKFIQNGYKDAILNKIPDLHQKAIIACYIAAKAVYTKGLKWSPSIVDILPLLAKDLSIINSAENVDLE
jgi:glutamate dehydrogenase